MQKAKEKDHLVVNGTSMPGKEDTIMLAGDTYLLSNKPHSPFT